MKRFSHRLSGTVLLFSFVGAWLLSVAMAAPAIPTATFTAVEHPDAAAGQPAYGFEGPTTVKVGLLSVTLQNPAVNHEQHEILFARLAPGQTVAEFLPTLAAGPLNVVPDQLVIAGGVGRLMPGQSGTAVIDLQPGNYAVLCTMPSAADGKPHALEGMSAELTVEAADASGEATTPPTADLTVTATDFAFTMPAVVPAGKHVLEFVNTSPSAHFMLFGRFAPKMTTDDLMAWADGGEKGPPAFADAMTLGSTQVISEGQKEYADVEMVPGKYFAVCLLRDPKTGKLHADMGMLSTFTVK